VSGEHDGVASPLVTVIGDLVEDIVVWRHGPITSGTDNPATIDRSRGGSAANVAVAAAAEGARARFIGRVGADAAGDRLALALEQSGVEARLQRGRRTGCVVVLVDDGGERTMFPDRAAAAELGAIAPGDLAGTAVLHVPLYGFLDRAAAGHLADAMSAAVIAGAHLSLDLAATSAIERLGAADVLRLVADVRPALVFANADEAQASGLGTIRPPGGGAFVIKEGPRPARLIRDDGSVELVAPAPVRTVRDTTGAGDRFAGAFLARWAAGASLVAACATGHVAAARTLGASGATVTETRQRR